MCSASRRTRDKAAAARGQRVRELQQEVEACRQRVISLRNDKSTQAFRDAKVALEDARRALSQASTSAAFDPMSTQAMEDVDRMMTLTSVVRARKRPRRAVSVPACLCVGCVCASPRRVSLSLRAAPRREGQCPGTIAQAAGRGDAEGGPARSNGEEARTGVGPVHPSRQHDHAACTCPAMCAPACLVAHAIHALVVRVCCVHSLSRSDHRIPACCARLAHGSMAHGPRSHGAWRLCMVAWRCVCACV